MTYTKEPFKFENLKVGDICIKEDGNTVKIIHIEHGLNFPIIGHEPQEIIRRWDRNGKPTSNFETGITYIKRPVKHKIGNKYKVTYANTDVYTVTLCRTNPYEYMFICDNGTAFSFQKIDITKFNQSLSDGVNEFISDFGKLGWKIEMKEE